ncbi:hypothetical protein FB45DRAFT_1118939 [Roridomyces roridus]|uniref:Xylanolytic transcriptional activator regulatory domain-containing protein n=1 Tax=Roridomyces roridus TaxID=1738132 RepID=A0AAD7B6L4_9AGAR|nr:hypothetical protein FB45DRAFT_1118939 [Roridomyces roridus]
MTFLFQRCDSVRPICGPCSRAQRFEDCEYGDAEGSNVQNLEDQISRLQIRIRDLERPVSNRPHGGGVPLQDPYRPQPGPSSMPPPPPPTFAQVLRFALEVFLPQATHLGFFLNQKRFRDTCKRLVSAPSTSNPDLPPALLNTILLWAAVLAPTSHLASHGQEASFLADALKQSGSPILSSMSTHRHKVIYALQVEVLLCQYFLYRGRLVEAQYHLSLAVSKVVVGGLSSIRSSMPASATGGAQILQPRDSIEEAEHIIGFWTVYSLDKIWSVVLNFPSNFAERVEIDTPWPLEMEEYERNQFPQHILQHRGSSALAILAKSASLLSSAKIMTDQWRENLPASARTALCQRIAALNNRIRKFRDSLPTPTALAAAGCPPTLKPSIILAHTTAHASTIQLNRPFAMGANANAQSMELCLRACRSIFWVVRALGVQDEYRGGANGNVTPYINPILGPLWLSTTQILGAEITKLRKVPQAAAVAADLSSACEEIVACMQVIAQGGCGFMRECSSSRYLEKG